jgi:hypothetical protein
VLRSSTVTKESCRCLCAVFVRRFNCEGPNKNRPTTARAFKQKFATVYFRENLGQTGGKDNRRQHVPHREQEITRHWNIVDGSHSFSV